MALLVIVIGVAFPSLRNFFRGRTLDSEARRFLSLTRYGQSRAVSEGIPMVLWIDARQHTYGLEAERGYLDEDTRAVEYELDENIEIEASAPPVVAQWMERSRRVLPANSLPAIRFSPDGFVGETSPEAVFFRQGDDQQLWIAQGASRLTYEIQTNRIDYARR
jgi:Tfp pilus assembly protein FimT